MKDKILATIVDLFYSTLISVMFVVGLTLLGLDDRIIDKAGMMAGNLYWLTLNWGGQTLGYRWRNIKLVRMDGSDNYGWMRVSWKMTICWGSAALVVFGIWVLSSQSQSPASFIFLAAGLLNFVTPLFNRNRFFLHDILSGTKVIKLLPLKMAAPSPTSTTSFSEVA